MKIFIIHGWTYNIDRWQSFVELLREAGHEPVQLLVPGLTEPSDKVWDIDGYVQWLHGKIGQEEAPVVLGHSNGGRISLAYCNAHPGHISQLVLVDSAGVAQTSVLPRLRLTALRWLSKLGKPLSRIPLLRKVFYRLIGASDYNNAPPNMKQTMQNMLAADKTIDLPSITEPTTIIWGRNDKITPLTMAQILHHEIQNSELHIIDDARHSPMITQPEAVAKIVCDVLEASRG